MGLTAEVREWVSPAQRQETDHKSRKDGPGGGRREELPTRKGLVKSEELLAKQQDRGEKSGDSSATESEGTVSFEKDILLCQDGQ